MRIIHPSTLRDVAIDDVALTEFVLRRGGELGDKAAFVDGASDTTVTFAELTEAVHRFAGGLVSRGFRPGDSLALVAPNLAEYAVAFHGAAVAGGACTPVNPSYGAEEIRFQLNDAAASKLITVPDSVATVLEAVRGTRVDEVFVIGEHSDAVPMADLTAADPIEQVPIDPSRHVVALPYSSGTTGLPKGVMLTHRNLVANLLQWQAVIGYRPEHSVLAALPFFHIYGLQVLMNGFLAEGCTVVTMARFDLAGALGLIEQHRITHFYAVPPMILALARQPVVEQFDLSSLELVLSAAAPLSAELAEQAAARLGCPVIQGYGMTELSPASHLTPPAANRPGSVGVTVPNCETRIVDPETGDDQGVGGTGELWVRGPNVMLGYLNNPQATADTIDGEGWLHTGDVAVIDEHRHVWIVDRVKELIKYKGFQVAPAELEALMLTHPAVADVAVVGVPDDEAGEIPKAFVVLEPGASATPGDLMGFVADSVATYKRVRALQFVDEIPTSPSGKILRRLLRRSGR